VFNICILQEKKAVIQNMRTTVCTKSYEPHQGPVQCQSDIDVVVLNLARKDSGPKPETLGPCKKILRYVGFCTKAAVPAIIFPTCHQEPPLENLLHAWLVRQAEWVGCYI
jgi:hypothetical protein